MIFHLGGILIETEASIPRLGDAYAILSQWCMKGYLKKAYDGLWLLEMLAPIT